MRRSWDHEPFASKLSTWGTCSSTTGSPTGGPGSICTGPLSRAVRRDAGRPSPAGGRVSQPVRFQSGFARRGRAPFVSDSGLPPSASGLRRYVVLTVLNDDLDNALDRVIAVDEQKA